MFIAGVAMDVVLGKLLEAVLQVKMKSEMYEETLRSIESKLRSIDPSTERIEELKKMLAKGKKEEMETLFKKIQEGEQLVLNCSSDTGGCCCFKKPRCMKDLIALDNSLERFYKIIMLETFIKTNEISDHVKEIHEGMKEIKGKVNELHEKVMEGDRKTDNKITSQQPVSASNSKLHAQEEEQTHMSPEIQLRDSGVSASNSHKQEEEQAHTLSSQPHLQDNGVAYLGRTTPSSDQPPKTEVNDSHKGTKNTKLEPDDEDSTKKMDTENATLNHVKEKISNENEEENIEE